MIKGKINRKYKTGEIILTITNRKTSPFPKIKLDTYRKTLNTLKRINKWLLNEAIQEAKSRNDEFNLIQFQNLNNLSQADIETLNLYLFDFIPKIPKPFLKPKRNIIKDTTQYKQKSLF